MRLHSGFAVFVILLLNGVIFAQAKGDSLTTSIDSLLNIYVDQTENVTSASKYSQYYADAPSSVSIVSRHSILNNQYTLMSEALNSLKGVYISDDRNYQYLGVRGFIRPADYNSRILILFNGHRLNDYFYNAAQVGPDFGLNLFGIENIELVRGPGSALYGASSMFATISLTPRKVVTGPVPEIQASYGSFNTRMAGFNWGIKPAEDFSVFINGSYSISDGEKRIFFSEYDDPETNNGIAENLDKSENYGLFFQAEYKNFSLSGFSSLSKKMVPTAAWETDFNQLQETEDITRFLEAEYTEQFSPNFKNTTKAYYDQYYYRGLFTYEEMEDLEFNNVDSYGIESDFIWDIEEKNRISFGVEYTKINRSDYKYFYDGDEYIYINDPYQIFSFYLQDEIQISSNTSLFLSLRSDNFKNLASKITPRVGLVYNPSFQHSIKLIYNNAFRNPSTYEREYYDPELNYIRNPNLTHEELRMYELIWEYEVSENLKSSISLYSYKVYDLINQHDHEDEGYIEFENSEDIKADGVELETQFRINDNLSGFINYSYQSVITEGGDYLTNSPMNLLKGSFSYQLPWYISVTAEYIFNSGRKTIRENMSPSVNLVNVSIMSSELFNSFRIGFKVRNLFNSKVGYPGGVEHLQNILYQSPRSFNISVYY